MPISYTLIRSRRKSLSIQIDTDGNLIARAPIHMLISNIEAFIISKKDWIEKHQKKIKNLPKKIIPNKGEIKEYKKILKEYIIPRIQKLSN